MIGFLYITLTIKFYNIQFYITSYLIFKKPTKQQMMLDHSSLEIIFNVYGNYISQNNPNNGFKISHFFRKSWENQKINNINH